MGLSQPKLKTATSSQMGGEGLQWVGAAPFSQTRHIFQNIGDGTYQHSGLLAIRAAVASRANITFKILYNDAVAMTGGQPAEGVIEPRRIVAQLLAEGVGTVRLVSDDPARWDGLPSGVTTHHRDDLDTVQRELREIAGVSAIVYEQTCAAEKRRRRKRGSFLDPDRRLFINPRVCEGCGDCSVQSNCIAVEPLATPLGTKRAINQSACNKDFSCVKGFCPSFVEIDGPVLRKPDGKRIQALEAELFARLPDAVIAPLGDVYNVYVAGIAPLGVARSKGGDVTVVTATAVEEMTFAAGPKLAPYFKPGVAGAQALKDFRAATGKAARLATQPPGSVPHTTLVYWLQEQLEADKADYEIVPMGIDATQNAVLTGAVDGATIREPADTIVTMRNPAIEVVALGGEMFPNQPGTVVAVSGAFLSKNPGGVQDLVTAVVRAVALIKADPAKAAPDVEAYLGKGLVDAATIEKALTSPASKFMADPRTIGA
eukprot:gene25764-28034_t